MNQKGKFKNVAEVFIHILIWTYLFMSPLLFRRGDESIDLLNYVQRLYFPASSCAIFYLNYLLLVPRYLLTRRYKQFIAYNLLGVLFFTISREYYMMLFPPFPAHAKMRRVPDLAHLHLHPMMAMFLLRNFVSLLFVAFLGTVVRLSMQWRKAEIARREAELGRTEAELKHLKSQINPHFLLNTLNNIYALTAFDTEKAQEAIQELSKMLRYMLYEDQKRFVSLNKEAEFLETYIALMRIRLAANVDVQIHFNIPPGNHLEVAPLIFISLVENAFKHGVSPTHPSFIHINLVANEQGILFSCRNSNFPKSQNDKNPNGIGLQQVRSRLEHSYPGAYSWYCGTEDEGKTYFSKITIHHKRNSRNG